MNVKYYADEDILVLKLTDSAVDYAEESNWVIIHFDAADKPVRIEILDASRFLELAGFALPADIKKMFFSPA